jgi:hypothetical protein
MSDQRPYRGISKDGKWVKGWYCLIKNMPSDKGRSYIISEEAELVPKYNHRSRMLYPYSGLGIYGFDEVIPESVGQSTGRRDKSDQEIHDSDNLQDSTGDIGTVYWKENVAGFYCKWGDGSDLPLNIGVATNKCKIISSIHDHLIKGAE